MSKRTVNLRLGINGAFCTRRWEEPENWMRITRELGFRCHEFCADVIDPFFSGDREYQLETARAVREAAERHGVFITDIYTGVATHRFHGLSHGDPRVRRRMQEWITDCMDIALAMGTDAVGGHWDALSVEALEDEERTQATMARTIDAFRDLARVAADKGLRVLHNEQMYIPSETPWTLAQTEEFLIAANRDSTAVPVRVTVDVGHQAGMHYGLAGDDLSYVEWIRRFGAAAEIIHLQQTTPDASHHWPFTAECNEAGHVEMDQVIGALRESHERWEQEAWAEHLAPADRAYLVAEIIPGSTKTEAELLKELAESADFLAEWVPEAGLVWEF
ncbi:MAG: sugar phosphate isomerase/epimerase family protein [Armatimonadota bacterium]